MSIDNTAPTSRLGKLIQAWGLRQEVSDKVWSRMADAGIGPHEPTAVTLAVETMFEEEAGSLIAAIERLPDQMERALGPASQAAAKMATATVEARMEEREAAALERLHLKEGEGKAELTRTARKSLEELTSAMVTTGNVIITEQVKRSIIHKVSAAVVIAAIVLPAVGYTAFKTGETVGVTATQNATADLRQLMQRSDFADWYQVAQYNDLKKVKADYCGTGPTNNVTTTAAGEVNCQVVLWFTPSPAAIGAPVADIVTRMTMPINDALRHSQPLALLIWGALGGSLLAWVGASIRKKMRRA